MRKVYVYRKATVMHLKYLKSVLRHKWFVFLECCKLGIPHLGIVHDLSKFLPSEWMPYARYFYGNYPPFQEVKFIPHLYSGRTRENVQREFDFGWLHHQHRNKHHWQRWILRLDHPENTKVVLLPMPSPYIREMLADWIGAGRVYGNPDVRGWYLKHCHEMQLHPWTRDWIEGYLGFS